MDADLRKTPSHIMKHTNSFSHMTKYDCDHKTVCYRISALLNDSFLSLFFFRWKQKTKRPLNSYIRVTQVVTLNTIDEKTGEYVVMYIYIALHVVWTSLPVLMNRYLRLKYTVPFALQFIGLVIHMSLCTHYLLFLFLTMNILDLAKMVFTAYTLMVNSSIRLIMSCIAWRTNFKSVASFSGTYPQDEWR